MLFNELRSQDGVLPDIMRAMNTCAAFIALCTPDDYCEMGRDRNQCWWQPRENVLFEMGMVSLARGAHRLTILQKWVNGQPDECAVLPSDWGGYVTVRFANDISAAFESLEQRLRKTRGRSGGMIPCCPKTRTARKPPTDGCDGLSGINRYGYAIAITCSVLRVT